jgi:DNA repair exonuclease SbcCD ATPase subunit
MIETVKIKKYKILENIEHDFSNHHVLICGQNGLGKSSVLQFIMIALGNNDIIPPGVDGSGEVWVNKHGHQYHLKVKIENGKSKVTITGEDNLSNSTRGALASVFGAVNLDVNHFIELSKTEKGRKEQVEVFKSMLPKETQEELRKIETHINNLYTERTELGRDIKKKDLEIKANPLNHLIDKELDKFQPVDVSASLAELKAAQEHNKQFERAVDKKTQIDEEVYQAQSMVNKLRVQLAEAEAHLKAKEISQMKGQDWLDDTKNKPKQVSHLEEKINSAQKINSDYENAQKLKADKKLFAEMVNDQENYTIRIETGRQSVQDAIKDIASEIAPGVSYSEEGLTWNGRLVHPNTHSTGEQLEMAMLLKMAENPDLEVLFLEHTESIDEDRMKRIIEIADSKGWQVLGEQVMKKQDHITFEIIGE